MPGEDKHFDGALVLDFRKRGRHVKTIYYSNPTENRTVPMQSVPWWLVKLLDRITQPALKQKFLVSDDEIYHHRSLHSHIIHMAKLFAPGRVGDFL